MRAINANTVDIATNWLPSVRVLGDLRAGVITYRNVIREHMLAETAEEKLAAEKTLAAIVESNNKIRQTYEPMITSPEERALYERVGQAVGPTTRRVPRKSWRCRARAAGKIPHEAHELNEQDGEQDRAGGGRNPEEGYRPQQHRRRQGGQGRGRQLQLGLHDARRHPRRRPSSSALRVSILPGSRCLARHCLDRAADAGAGRWRPDRAGAASGRENRDRLHGGYAAGVQGSADRQEGRRRGRGA